MRFYATKAAYSERKLLTDLRNKNISVWKAPFRKGVILKSQISKRVQFFLFDKKGTLVKRVLKGENPTPVSCIAWQQT